MAIAMSGSALHGMHNTGDDEATLDPACVEKAYRSIVHFHAGKTTIQSPVLSISFRSE